MSGKKNNKEEPDILKKAIDAFMPEMMKKLLLVSIGGIMLTEEAIRKILSDVNLSKDIVSVIIQQSYKAKDEGFRIVRSEFRSLLKSVNIEKEIRRILEDTKVKVQLEIEFESKKDGDSIFSIEPKIKQKEKKKHKKKDKDE